MAFCAPHLNACSGPSLKRQHEQCVVVTRLLEDLGDAAAAKKWRDMCAEAFKFSRVFGGSRQVALTPDYSFDGMVEAFGLLSFK